MFGLGQSTLRCKSCSTKVPVRDMKYDYSGQNLICLDCYDKQAKPKPVEKPVKIQPKEIIINYSCTSCGYKFSRKQGFEFNFCPYCGKASVTVQPTDGAQEIISSSSSSEFRFM